MCRLIPFLLMLGLAIGLAGCGAAGLSGEHSELVKSFLLAATDGDSSRLAELSWETEPLRAMAAVSREYPGMLLSTSTGLTAMTGRARGDTVFLGYTFDHETTKYYLTAVLLSHDSTTWRVLAITFPEPHDSS